MARFLGLDLGSYSVKAIVLEGTLRAFEAKHFYEVPRAQEGDKGETLKAALETLLGQLQLHGEIIVAALQGPSLATHAFSLPFADPKKLEAALPFEVESQLPFNLEDASFDYQPTFQDSTKTDLLVAVARKEEVRALTALLAEHKLDPRIITHPAIVYQNLLAGAPGSFQSTPEGEAVCILDIGHERTHVAVGVPGKGIDVARTFAGGGKDLSRAIGNEFKASLEEANAWKEQHASLTLQKRTPEVERASNALVRGLQPLLREIRPTLKAFAAKTRKNVTRVYLCGGTAKIPGICEQLTRDIGLPVELLELPQASAAIPPESAAIAAQAFALALRGQSTGTRGPRLNFRRGEFAFKGDFDFVKEKIPILAAFTAALLALMITSGIVRNIVLSRHEAQVDQLLCDTTKRVLNTCEKSYDLALNKLQGTSSPAARIPKRSAVNFLAELSQRLPADVPITIEQVVVDVDSGRIQLRAEMNNSKDIDKLVASLKAFKCFKEVKEGKIEKGKSADKYRFPLDIQIECPDQVAAPQG
jgi:general secretion pathway protein L